MVERRGDKLRGLFKEGQALVIAAAGQCRLLHVNELDGLAQASPALAGKRWLIQTEHRLYSIRRGK